MIKYLGSKRKLVPAISALVGAIPEISSAADLFTGTTRVAQALKQLGLHVIANDMATFAHIFATTYVATDSDDIEQDHIEQLLNHLRGIEGSRGYITRTFSERARYFQPHNAIRIDSVRAEIDMIAPSDPERSILLTSLIEAADRVDSTAGVQMAYLKQWAQRSSNMLDLRMPHLVNGTGEAIQSDAVTLAGALDGVDLAYLDPPYNQHSYLGNYHVWETIARGDQPEHYGVAAKRIDTRTSRSDFNSSRRAPDAFADLLGALRTPWILVSFNNEGFFDRDTITEMLQQVRPHVMVLPVTKYPRYVGARIGIHNHEGHKVGEPGHLTNTEYLFLAGHHLGRAEAAMSAASQVVS